MAKNDTLLLEAALRGYEIQITQFRAEVDAIIKKLRAAGVIAAVPGGIPGRKRRRISAAARKRISAAQKKRSAIYKKQTK